MGRHGHGVLPEMREAHADLPGLLYGALDETAHGGVGRGVADPGGGVSQSVHAQRRWCQRRREHFLQAVAGDVCGAGLDRDL